MVDFELVIVGGEGAVVEVERINGKRKYNRGSSAESVWVVTDVERTSNKLIFCKKLTIAVIKLYRKFLRHANNLVL